MNRTKTIILSDTIRIGKTTTLQIWVKEMPHVAGFLSPVIDGKRMFQDIRTGQQIPMETEHKDLEVGKYAFDSASFTKVEEKIRELWNEQSLDYLVIDEIGPLEIRKDKGFHQLIKYLSLSNSEQRPQLVFVVRDYCLDEFIEKYHFPNVEVFSLPEFKHHFLN